MESEAFVKITLAVISLVGALITGLVMPYLKTKIDANRLIEIQYWVDVAVRGAEQIFNEPKMGEEKKQFVINFLSDKGIKITMAELNLLIEAAVKELNLVQKSELE